MDRQDVAQTARDPKESKPSIVDIWQQVRWALKGIKAWQKENIGVIAFTAARKPGVAESGKHRHIL